MNCSPVPDTKTTLSPEILVTVVGNVQFGINSPVGFYTVFILEKDPTKQQRNAYYVASSSFRYAKTSADEKSE